MDTSPQLSGFILINKPQGISSHGVISVLRRASQIKRIGHAGTLDPLASGLLIVAVGRESTKKIDQFQKQEKEYLATIKFGIESVSYDAEGPLVPVYAGPAVELEIIATNLRSFIGQIEQLPPAYSAKKVKGRRLYDLARKNQPLELRPSLVEIKDIEVISYIWPELKVKINCGSGTYIRSIAHDLGKKLGCGAYLADLVRTKIGDYAIDQAVELDRIDRDNWQQYIF